MWKLLIFTAGVENIPLPLGTRGHDAALMLCNVSKTNDHINKRICFVSDLLVESVSYIRYTTRPRSDVVWKTDKFEAFEPWKDAARKSLAAALHRVRVGVATCGDSEASSGGSDLG